MENQLTQVLPYTQDTINQASKLLKQGKLVSFPTETVYGLGANALNADACKLIFTTKGRPLTDPLIVHVHSLEQALSLIDQSDAQVIDLFKKLAEKYWPGPLTMVVKANLEVIPSLVTAETGFVGIRMPNHPIALDLIKTSGLPLAAPSANKFGHVSPTKAEHVYYDFHKDSEVLIIDGGQCSFGIESTVLKLAFNYDSNQYELLILRRGGVSEQNLNTTLHQDLGIQNARVEALQHKHFKKEEEQLEAPGQFLRHYAPDIDSFLFKGIPLDGQQSQLDLKEVVLLDFNAIFADLKDRVKYYYDLSASGDYFEAINSIYDILRWAETKKDAKCVLITNFKELMDDHSQQALKGLEHRDALFDRIYRATSGREI